MKKILFSVLTIAIVSATAFGVSQAFFSDTEKSIGNTFTAGSIDLIFKDVGPTASTPITGPLFTLTDLKPGDLGEKTVSLKVEANPACVFVDIAKKTDSDVSCNAPELIDEEDCTNDGDGELDEQVQFGVWEDTNCNNILEPGENLLVNGPLSSDKHYSIGELDSTEKCYGIGYCFGSWVQNQVDQVIKVKCDGSLINNASQTDSFTGDIIITAKQKRNQYPNGCPAVGEYSSQVYDYLDIGNIDSEVGHNLLGWSNNWVNPGWGGNYGGGSSDNSFRLLMGKGDVNGCTVPDARPATFTMNAGAGMATKLTLEHLDGAVNDSFDVYINGVNRGSYLASSVGGAEVWKTTLFTFPGETGTVNVELRATYPVGSWCNDWGQVGFSNAKLE